MALFPVMLAFAVALGACGSKADAVQAAWTVKVPAGWGGVAAGQVVGDIVVVQTRLGIGALDRGSGAVRWYRSAPENDSGSRGWDHVFVTTDQAGSIVTAANTAALSAFDATDGSTLFTRQPGVVAMRLSGPVVVRCPAGEQRRCTAEGLAPRTGKVRWQQQFDGAQVQLVGAFNDGSSVEDEPESAVRSPRWHVAMPFQVPAIENIAVATTTETVGEPGGTARSVRVVNATTGAMLAGPPLPAGYTARLMTDRLLLEWKPGRARCERAVNAVDVVTGVAMWSATVGGLQSPPASEATMSCDDGLNLAAPNGRLPAMTADGRPVVLDLDTGTSVWNGKAGAHLSGVAANRAVWNACYPVGEGGEECEFAGVDIASGKTLWRYPADGRWADSGIGITDTHFAFYLHTAGLRGEEQLELTIIDTSSGKVRTAAGSNRLISVGANWLLTDGRPVPASDGDPLTLRLFIS